MKLARKTIVFPVVVALLTLAGVRTAGRVSVVCARERLGAFN